VAGIAVVVHNSVHAWMMDCKWHPLFTQWVDRVEELRIKGNCMAAAGLHLSAAACSYVMYAIISSGFVM
jgi:hypothetical protein